MTERGIQPIDEQQWMKIAVAIPPLVTTTIVMGKSIFGWQFGDAQSAAIVAEVSAIISLIGIVVYGATSTTHAAVLQYIAGAYRMGRRETGDVPSDEAPYRVGAVRGVAPTREQVKRYVEHEAGS